MAPSPRVYLTVTLTNPDIPEGGNNTMAILTSKTDPARSDDRWMGSRHGVAEAHPGTLKATAFATAAGVVNGIVPSGYPLVKDGDLYGPFVQGTSTAAQLAGFSIDDRDINGGDEFTVILWHGRIRTAFLPITMTPVASTAFVFA